MFVLPKNFGTFVSCFLGDIGVLMIPFGIALLVFKSDIRVGKALIWATGFFSIFMLGISFYYSYYLSFPSIYNLKQFSTGAAGDAFAFVVQSFLTILKNAQFLFLIPLVIFLIIWIAFIHRKIKQNSELKNHQIIGNIHRIYIGIIVTLLGIFSLLISDTMYQKSSKDKGYEDLKLVAEGVQSVGIVNYYLFEVSDYIFFNGRSVDNNKITQAQKELEEYLNDEEAQELNNQFYKGVFEGKNLLLIQMESMNNFLIGLKVNINGEEVEVTPFLNQLVLSQASAYFNNYYTTVGIGNTSDAEFAVLTGLYPTGYSYSVYEYLDGMNYETLPKLFKDKGYYCFSAHGNTGEFYMRNTLHLSAYGFDEHVDKEAFIEAGVYNPDGLVHDFISDRDFLDYSLQVMKERSEELNQPIFNFSITVSAHMPYEMSFEKEPPESDKAQNMFLEKERLFPYGFKEIDEQYMSYLEHASYADYALSKAFEKLEEYDLLKDTVVVLYGDHGCGIDIYNMFYDNSDILSNDINPLLTKSNLDQSIEERQMLLEVPFIIYDGSEKTTFSKTPYTLVRNHNCVLRTLANLFNLDNKYAFGVDCLGDELYFSYNPRNMDILVDGVAISGISQEAFYDKNYNGKKLTTKEIEEIINRVYRFKDFNDKVLKYGLFKQTE